VKRLPSSYAPPTASALPAKPQRDLIDGASLAGGMPVGGQTMLYARGQSMVSSASVFWEAMA
jgi:hypothetical protein